MPTDDERGRPPTAESVVPAPAEAPGAVAEPGRVHLVVVSTRAVNPGEPGETAPAGAVLRTRFWHPRDRRWSENVFESLDHALRLFVEESGWVLRQQQALDRPHAHELIFEARREDFSRPSAEEMLRDVGLTPREVAGLIERVDAERRGK
jgi:hypothetical protein